MMLKYVGPIHDDMEVYDAETRQTIVFALGAPAEVRDALGENLLTQVGNWVEVKPSRDEVK